MSGSAGGLLVVDNPQDLLFEFAIDSGDRIVVSGGKTGDGPAFDRPHCVAHGIAHEFVGDTNVDAVFAVVHETGKRMIIAGGG